VSFILENISRLLHSVEIDRIKGKEKVPISYAGFRTESLLRIHLLPYFFPFNSYRHLAFLVAERPELQEMVRLKGPDTPSRATLWHFRNRYSNLFRLLLARALALMSIGALQEGIQVEFCSTYTGVAVQDCCCDTFIDSKSKFEVRISSSLRPKIREEQLNLALFPFNDQPEQAQQKKVNLYDEIELPMHVGWSKGSESLTLCVDQPSWSEFPEIAQDLGVILGRAGKKPYTACNVIILQNNNVLLSERLTGSGKGTYALPGGKMHDGESIWRCVVRELKEEVGLEFLKGFIVSDRQTNHPGFPQVRSIGVVATDWGGELKKENLEPYAHGKWEWYAFTNLPTPIFFPTERVLDDYLGKKFQVCPLEDDLPLSAYWR
jgi:ADP-ribose pyrophosphatase YjhB (NUDIX family)